MIFIPTLTKLTKKNVYSDTQGGKLSTKEGLRTCKKSYKFHIKCVSQISAENVYFRMCL